MLLDFFHFFQSLSIKVIIKVVATSKVYVHYFVKYVAYFWLQVDKDNGPNFCVTCKKR